MASKGVGLEGLASSAQGEQVEQAAAEEKPAEPAKDEPVEPADDEPEAEAVEVFSKDAAIRVIEEHLAFQQFLGANCKG